MALADLANFDIPLRGRLRLIVELEDETKIAAADSVAKIIELKRRGPKSFIG